MNKAKSQQEKYKEAFDIMLDTLKTTVHFAKLGLPAPIDDLFIAISHAEKVK